MKGTVPKRKFAVMVTCLLMGVWGMHAQPDEAWTLAFSDDATADWSDAWFLDGLKALVTRTPQGLVFRSGPIAEGKAKHASNAVLWTHRSFAGDLRVEYDFTRLDANLAHTSVCILYLQATGTGQGPYAADIHAWRQLRDVPAMNLYYDHMHLYHVSYACTGGNDFNYVRARRYPSSGDFDRSTRLLPSYENVDLFKPGETWHLRAEKVGRSLALTATRGDGTHRWTWDASGHPPITEGRIGLRQMQGRESRYANFRVFLRKEPSSR